MLEASGLVKRYGSRTAVDGVSFTVRRGDTLGLLGPNGAGKTTTLQMLVGAIAPDAGTVRFADGGDPGDPEVRRRIGVAPQTLALYPELSAAENLAFFASLYGLHGARRRERVAWCLDFAGLSERQRDRVATFSGGMQRRLNLACALVHEPELLLLDEPTVGVDPQSRNHIFARILGLRGAGLTVLYTTHYMEEAERLCTRIAILDHGRILAFDGLDALLRAHGGGVVVEGELEAAPAPGTRLPGELDGLTLRMRSDDPPRTLRELAGSGLHFRTLRMERPDLESVFLHLTGRHLRDDA
ncbi:MAG: ABC transporter ATP-binding protein [Planctomycetes bacterium]|nr:ABC transporter ATP-binding protein [Planctomycetota bacterium]